MRALEGSAKALYLGFFASHIVFTLIVDVQAILPPSWVPDPLQSLLAFYAATFNDPLMQWPTPMWFRSVVVCEMAFQLPFFFVACHQIAREPNPSSSSSSKGLQYYPGWFRNACVAYGAHTATTLVPILTTLVSSPTNSPSEKVVLVSLYAPYLILPLGILYLACVSDDSDNDIAAAAAASVARSKKAR
jgi:EXPERA (EXPanded EBP superfamily)